MSDTPPNLYTTGEIARLCDVSVRTVQYYDTRRILIPTTLSEGGRRLYSEEDLYKMKIICYLRDLDLSIDNIAKLMREENSSDVIALILEEQEALLKEGISEKQGKLRRLNELRQHLCKSENVSLASIGDIASVVENKKMMKKLHISLVLSAIPIEIAEWGAALLWIFRGIWWPFLLYTAIAIPYGIFVSAFYFKKVEYICPNCHRIFIPRFRKAFWAFHTPYTRKLTCTHCGYKGYCVETYRKEKQ